MIDLLSSFILTQLFEAIKSYRPGIIYCAIMEWRKEDMSMNKEDYIGVFDSGVGGISVLQAIHAMMPGENLYFFGDSKNAPYGEKTLEEVQQLTLKAIAHMKEKKNLKAIVIACNTATSAAVTLLRDKYTDIPVIGIEPALKPAVLAKKNSCILVMATANTLRLDKFHQLAERYDKSATIIPVPCYGLAKRIEQGHLENHDLIDLLDDLIGPYKGKIDSVVLGCTHYPFVKKQIAEVLGDIPMFDGAYGTSKHLRHCLQEKNCLNNQEEGKILYDSSKVEEIPLYQSFMNTPIE